MELWADGTGRLTVQKGKNQTEPQTVAVTAATARALRELRPKDADPSAPVFGLTGEALANRVRAAAKAAGLGDGFSGHSGRIGMARRMVCRGSAQCGSAAPRPMEARRHGGPLHPGRGGRGGTEVADMTKAAPTSYRPADSTILDKIKNFSD